MGRKPVRSRGRIALAGVLLPALGMAQQAADAERAAAKADFAEGTRCFDRGDYECAATRYESAFARTPSAPTLMNLGIALLQLRRNAEAADALERYLAGDLPGFKRAMAGKLRKQLAKLRRKLGRLRIAVNEAGAEVRVDGRLLGTSPLPRAAHADPGQHRVEAQKPGFYPETSDIQIRRGVEADVALALRPKSVLSITVNEADAADWGPQEP